MLQCPLWVAFPARQFSDILAILQCRNTLSTLTSKYSLLKVPKVKVIIMQKGPYWIKMHGLMH